MGDDRASRPLFGKQRQRPMPKMGCDDVRGETYSTVRTSPHFLQLELLHARLVMVAHLTPTEYFLMASAESTVT